LDAHGDERWWMMMVVMGRGWWAEVTRRGDEDARREVGGRVKV